MRKTIRRRLGALAAGATLGGAVLAATPSVAGAAYIGCSFIGNTGSSGTTIEAELFAECDPRPSYTYLRIQIYTSGGTKLRDVVQRLYGNDVPDPAIVSLSTSVPCKPGSTYIVRLQVAATSSAGTQQDQEVTFVDCTAIP